MGSLRFKSYYSMHLKKGLNGVFLETTAATFTPFLIVPVSIDFLRPIESIN